MAGAGRAAPSGACASASTTSPRRSRCRCPSAAAAAARARRRARWVSSRGSTDASPRARSTVSFFASRAFPPVRLTVVGPDGRRRARSRCSSAARRAARAARAARPRRRRLRGRRWRFLHLGFTHILPEGLDHVLFVLGLALLSSRLGPLLAQVTAFTLAHTVTLALAVYGVVSLPSRDRGAADRGVHRLRRGREPLPPGGVVAAPGPRLRASGCSTASGSRACSPSWAGRRDGGCLALLSFNLGVELGQLAVIAIALGLPGRGEPR